jgi:hypothetical protein
MNEILIEGMFHRIIMFMLDDYLFVDCFGPTEGMQGSYINILHIYTDDHCVFLFVPVGMYTCFNIMIYTF